MFLSIKHERESNSHFFIYKTLVTATVTATTAVKRYNNKKKWRELHLSTKHERESIFETHTGHARGTHRPKMLRDPPLWRCVWIKRIPFFTYKTRASIHYLFFYLQNISDSYSYSYNCNRERPKQKKMAWAPFIYKTRARINFWPKAMNLLTFLYLQTCFYPQNTKQNIYKKYVFLNKTQLTYNHIKLRLKLQL